MSLSTSAAGPASAASRFWLRTGSALSVLASWLSSAAAAAGFVSILVGRLLDPPRPLPGRPSACSAAAIAFLAGWWPSLAAAGPASLLGAVFLGLACVAPLAVDGLPADAGPLAAAGGGAGCAASMRAPAGSAFEASALLGDPVAWLCAAGLPALAGLSAAAAVAARRRARAGAAGRLLWYNPSTEEARDGA